ncbi:type IV secretion system protein VirB11 [Nitrosospira sp. Nsp5]|uniref:Type IV secretion system protein VirB11 n=1 Tax=Nitrosospira multiformis TaxID=1231 RepID=A0ABY0TPY2_9PROT|nr:MULTISPECIES: P-type conjugative transfer ATPase TrbB [Nitrosospira]PTR05615.1 type IV secretion system protein VirB11 [Nitrosospira sp. Nsp5]SDR11185.1 type IV secretion system protein VirB11 [Nitrosospira multiformis]
MDQQDTIFINDRAKLKLARDLGDEFLLVLHDPKTVEIMLNADGRLWQERLGEPMRCFGTMRAATAQSIIRNVAGMHGRELTSQNPTLECEFPLDGSRFAGQIPPVVSEAVFAIRKKAVAVFTLDDYVKAGIMTPGQCERIRVAVAVRSNILVSGGTGSGKTTLVNAILNHVMALEPLSRVVIIEDTGEIQCTADNYIQYHTSAEVGMTQLLRTTLRMRPDRIIVGEVRGPEALDLLMAWNTGHQGGVATLHANDARAGLSRLAMLISMHPDSPKPIEPLIGEAVQLIVHIARASGGLGNRRIEEILELSGFDDGHYLIQPFKE